jgi:hypothetical protein
VTPRLILPHLHIHQWLCDEELASWCPVSSICNLSFAYATSFFVFIFNDSCKETVILRNKHMWSMFIRVLGDKNAVSNSESSRIMVLVVEIKFVLKWNHSTDALFLFAIIIKVKYRGHIDFEVNFLAQILAVQL